MPRPTRSWLRSLSSIPFWSPATCHMIAVRAERDAVKAAGVSWRAYQSFMKKHEKPIEEERFIRVPRDLDLTPYRDEKDFGLLQRLVRKQK